MFIVIFQDSNRQPLPVEFVVEEVVQCLSDQKVYLGCDTTGDIRYLDMHRVRGRETYETVGSPVEGDGSGSVSFFLPTRVVKENSYTEFNVFSGDEWRAIGLEPMYQIDVPSDPSRRRSTTSTPHYW